MKIALITDTHFGARSDSHAILNSAERFFTELFFPYLDLEGVKTIIHLGDVFDRRKYINFSTLQRVRQFFFDEIKKRGIDLHIILGNHDLYFRSTSTTNSPELLLPEYNFKIYQNAENLNIPGDSFGRDFLFVPWITPENEKDTMAKISEGRASVVLGHMEVKGFEMLRGHVCETGIEKSMFDKYRKVFSGHFHHRSSQGDIMYLGCPFEMTWADYGNQKGFHIFDTENFNIKFMANPFKQFQRIEYDDLQKLPSLVAEELEGCYIKLIIKRKTDPQAFEKFMGKLNKINTSSVIITEEKVQLDQEAEALGDVEDTLSFIKKAVEGLTAVNTDKGQLLNLIYDLYKKANELE